MLLPILMMFIPIGSSERWAVLIAGSKGFSNYRHQAGILHAYNRLILNDFLEDNIFLMVYNDIASHPSNPYKGKVFNQPDERNFYEGISITYQGDKITADTIYNVLAGKRSFFQTIFFRKYLKLKKEDTVLVFLVGHGSYGIFHLPDHSMLTRDKLVSHINDMAGKCKSVLVIIDSSHSGSLFNETKVSLAQNVITLTSTDSYTNSYACYWNKELKTFTGNDFTTSVIENWDRVYPTQETINELFLFAKAETQNKGNISFNCHQPYIEYSLHTFIGGKDLPAELKEKPLKNSDTSSPWSKNALAVPQTQWFRYQQIYLAKKEESDKKKYEKFLNDNAKLNKVFHDISNLRKNRQSAFVRKLSQDSDIFNCYTNSIRYFRSKCEPLLYLEQTYSLFGNFWILCEKGYSIKIINDQINNACKSH